MEPRVFLHGNCPRSGGTTVGWQGRGFALYAVFAVYWDSIGNKSGQMLGSVMDLDKEILLREIDLVREERLRRSKQQFEYVRLSLINVGVLSLFGVFSVISKDVAVAENIAANARFMFALMAVLTVISVTLFLFWVDDAITIGGLDRFLLHKEESVDTKGDLYWFEYRQQLNKTMPFQVKKWVFNLAIVLSFVCPPFLFGVFALLHDLLEIPVWVQITGATCFLMLLLIPLWIWRRFTKRLYG